MRKFALFILLILTLSLKPYLVYADDTPAPCTDEASCTKLTNELTQKLSDLGKAKNTLANQIAILNSQTTLTILKITQTQENIKTTINDIGDLSTKINKLDVSLNKLSSIYIDQVTQNYKLSKRIPSYSIFSNNFNQFLEQFKYLSVVQKNNQETLLSLETVRTNFDIQKEQKKQKQTELESLKKKLADQQNSLTKQKASKANLLETTKNNEVKYQQLLADALRQLNALRNFSSSNGSSCLTSSPGGGVGGWFYSQRDPKWCRQYIGYSKDTIGEVGCLISSVSMIWKKYGQTMDPSIYASYPGYFLGSTAWMTTIATPPGLSYQQYSGYRPDILDKELKADRPVIVQISMKGTSAGMHFVVLKSGSGGKYIMNDPWFGSDLNFSDHYNTGLIMSLRVFTK